MLSNLYSEAVGVGVVQIGDASAVATTAEIKALGSAVAKRRMEFSAGRHAARMALSGIGLPATDILIGRHRQPLPPSGVVLGITHDSQHALAVAALSERWLGIGVDICDADSLSEGLIHAVCRGSDLQNLVPGESIAERAKLVFCLKEALFKAIFPQVSDWMEFEQSELSIDHSSGKYAAKVFAADGSALPLQGVWRGRFAKVGSRWIAGAEMLRP